MFKKLISKFKSDPISEPLELRDRIAGELLLHLKAIGDGEYALPGNHVSIAIAVAEKSKKNLLVTAFGDGKLADFLNQKLAQEKCRQRVNVSLSYVDRPKKNWKLGNVFELSFQESTEKADVPTVIIKILTGKASKKQYKFKKETINLGRGAEVYDKYGTLIRKNDVAFDDIAQEPNNTVSKIHALVKYSPVDQVFYLADSGFEHGLVTNGTRVFREGNLLAKLNGDQKAKLETGDEINLGKASIRLETQD